MERKKIFVVGSSRSGTTMMGRILTNHQKVFTFHELHFFEKMCAIEEVNNSISSEKAIELLDRLLGTQRVGYFIYKPTDWGQFSEEAQLLLQSCPSPYTPARIYEHFCRYEAGLNKALHSCDQTPRNALLINELLSCYPDAYFVVMVRDPRAVMASQKRKWRRRFLGVNQRIPVKESIRNRFNYHPLMMGILWRAATLKGVALKDHERVHIVRFEDFLQEPEKELEAICQAIKIDYHPDMLNVPQVGSSHAQDVKGELGIRKEVSDSWKTKSGLSRGEIYCNQLLTGGVAKGLGYEMDRFGFPPVSAIASLLFFPISAFLAFMANIGQAQNLMGAIKRRLFAS